MRVSILVNSVDPTACHDYALLWLDPARHGWTRQTCVGIALPPDGAICERGGMTLLSAPSGDAEPLLTIGNFRLDAHRKLTSIFGTATWFSLSRNAVVEGRWHLRAVERSPGTQRGQTRAPGQPPPPWRRDERSNEPGDYR